MVKAKNMMYVQDLAHLPFDNLEECLENIEKVLKPEKFAGIIHDKDITKDGKPKESHIHVMMQFENARSINNIAKLLNEKSQYFEKWDGDSTNGYSYLLHETSNANDQHQYDVSEVKANFDFKTLIENARKGIRRPSSKDEIIIQTFLDLLYTGAITKEEVEKKLSGSQYAKARARIENVCQKRMEHYAKEWKDKMEKEEKRKEVVWVYGASGVGKTRLAKVIAHTYSSDVFLSGSSRDPFQRYQLEEVIILDELRYDTFEYNDLLKMFDPFNDDAMGASRYYDKPLTASLIIVTSPYPPHIFFEKIVNDGKKMDQTIDSFKQLARRLGLVIYLTKEFMESAFFKEKDNRFVIEKSTRELNPYWEESNNLTKIMHERTEKLYKDVVVALKQNKEPAIEPTKANDDESSTAVQLSLELSHAPHRKESDVEKNEE